MNTPEELKPFGHNRESQTQNEKTPANIIADLEKDVATLPEYNQKKAEMVSPEVLTKQLAGLLMAYEEMRRQAKPEQIDSDQPFASLADFHGLKKETPSQTELRRLVQEHTRSSDKDATIEAAKIYTFGLNQEITQREQQSKTAEFNEVLKQVNALIDQAAEWVIQMSQANGFIDRRTVTPQQRADAHHLVSNYFHEGLTSRFGSKLLRKETLSWMTGHLAQLNELLRQTAATGIQITPEYKALFKQPSQEPDYAKLDLKPGFGASGLQGQMLGLEKFPSRLTESNVAYFMNPLLRAVGISPADVRDIFTGKKKE